MTDQNYNQQFFAQDEQLYGAADGDFNPSEAEVEEWARNNPEMVAAAMQGVQTGTVGNLDVDMEYLFPADPTQQAQVPTPAPAPAPEPEPASHLPPNTMGPFYDPANGWHVKSTLPHTIPLPDPTDPTFVGPYYAPAVEWHYKMRHAPNPGQMAPPPMPGIQEGYTPSPGTTLPSGMTTPVGGPFTMPQVQSDPMEGVRLPLPKSKPARKPKYGPAVFLSQQAKGSLSGPPRAASVSEAHYTSAAKRRDHQSGDPTPTGCVGRRPKKTSIVQVCVCSDKPKQKVKRPRNAFILYRSAKKEFIMKSNKTRDNQTVSTSAATMWKDETEEVKKRFHDMAAQEKLRHQQEHPDYKYEPGLAARQRFGSANCTCGAYQLNMRNLMAKLSGNVGAALAAPRARKPATPFDDDEDEEEDDFLASGDDDEYMPPKSQRAAPPPPPPRPAVYTTYQVPQSGVALPRMAIMPGIAVAPMIAQPFPTSNRKRTASAMVDEELGTESRLSKRLRSTPVVNFDPEDDVFNGEFGSPPPGGPFNPEDSPPARNTRAQSKARNSLTPPGTASGLDENGMAEQVEEVGYTNYWQQDADFDWMDQLGADDLFGENEDVGENIVVAERRPSQSPNHPYSLRPRGGSKSPEQQ